MWREGLSIELVAWIVNALALAFGAGLGARGLIDPTWAAQLVRLQPDAQGGGFAEFRATFGGLFLGAHAAALFFTLRWIVEGHQLIGLFAAGAAAALAGAWGGAGAGRGLALARDRALATPFNRLSMTLEFVMAVLIAAPWLAWGLGWAR